MTDQSAGDRLYDRYEATGNGEPEDKEWGDLIGSPPYGSLLATVPSRAPAEVVPGE
jgi:hypothetical protein